MLRSLIYIKSGLRVLYDKLTDYFAPDPEPGDSDSEDLLINYGDLINTESYQDESETSRLYKPSGPYLEYSTFFRYPTHIIDNIYLGSAFNAASYETLRDLNIKIIINATAEISEYYPQEFTYIRYKLYDNNKNSVKKYLEDAYNNIKYHQENTKGNILIHCFMGASRSASLVIYYLIKTKSYSFDEALNFVKNKRAIVNPTFRLTKDLASSIMQI